MSAQRDFDFDRKARVEEGDRLAANARQARLLLRGFWRDESSHRVAVRVLVASGAFSIPEAVEALAEIELDDARLLRAPAAAEAWRTGR